MAQKSILVIGGGFAGVNLVKGLSRQRDYIITLIDKNNYNFFVPLLYQVATGFLETSSICSPFRKLFREKSSVHFRLGTLLKVNTEKCICYLDNGEVPYDFLVFATGSVINYYRNENIAVNSIAMKTVDDALNMRNQLLQMLERACRTESPFIRMKLTTIVIAGGGPTGVEVAGVIAELRKYIIEKDYPELIDSIGSVYVVEGSQRLLAQMSVKSHQHAYDTLSALGVKIILGNLVKDFKDEEVILSNGDRIYTPNLIWAAGVTASFFDGIPKAFVGQGNRTLVDPYNRVRGLTNVFAIGDMCLLKSDIDFPNGHPQLAQVAIQQAKNLAYNLRAIAKGKLIRPFRYKDKGSMAIIGRNHAVADLVFPELHLKGKTGLFVWLIVHLNSLISCENKAKTLLNWIIAYFTRDQGLRMIIRPTKTLKGSEVDTTSTSENIQSIL